MRHLKDSTHLNRTRSHRRALASNITSSLFVHRKLVTTLAKARYVRRFAERMITFARRGDVAARRHVNRYIHDREALKKLFGELGEHFRNRNGGYTRIIKLGPRRGDAAPMALLELVGFDDVSAPAIAKKPTKSRLKAAQRSASQTKREKPTRKAAPSEPEEEVTPAEEPKGKVDSGEKSRRPKRRG